jgi:hypothetical protein
VRKQLIGLGVGAVLAVGSAPGVLAQAATTTTATASGGTTQSIAVASGAGPAVTTDTTTTTRRDYTGLWGLLGLLGLAGVRPRKAVVVPGRPLETRAPVERAGPPTDRR